MSKVTQRGHATYSPETQILSVIEELTARLRQAGITDPRRVATDIIASLLEVPRSWPVVNRESSISEATLARAHAAVHKLAKGAPFAYAVGNAAFRRLTLNVDERVLIPRPETEALVEEVLERMQARFGNTDWGTAVDIGTGSGAIALSLAAEGKFSRVIATDASSDALAVAVDNRDSCQESLHSTVEFRHGSFTAPLAGVRASAVVSNPPYIAFAEMESLPPDVRDWEPPLALYSGHSGMSAIAAIIRGAHAILERGGLLALEVDERRASLAAELIMRRGNYTDVGVGLDLTGRERFVFASRI